MSQGVGHAARVALRWAAVALLVLVVLFPHYRFQNATDGDQYEILPAPSPSAAP